MPSDPSIYGLIKDQPGPLDQYGKVLNLKALMGQNQLQGLQTEKLTGDMAEESAAKDYLKGLAPGTDPSSPEAIAGLQRIAPTRAMQYQKDALAARKTTGEIAHTAAQTGEITAGHIAGAWGALAQGGGSDESVKNAEGMMAPLLGPEKAAAVTQKLLSMPPETRLAYAVAQAGAHKTGQEALKLFFPQAHMQDTGGTVTPVSTSTLPGGAPAGTPLPGTTPLAKTQTPDSAAVDARTAREGNLNRANHLLVAGLGPDGKPLNAVASGEKIDLAKIDKADLEAGYRYFADGTLPPNMGRGQQGAAESKRLRGIAAQIGENLGISPEEARANQLAFKGSGQAVTALVKREAQVGANVRNFDFNADQVLQLSQKVGRTGTPVINEWLNAGKRSVEGNPEIAAFDVAVKTTVNEFAQIVSGTTAGATTEGEKQKAEKLLSAAQTPAQIQSVINQMRIESQNRMKSFADQKKETLGNLRAGGPKPTTDSAAQAKATDKTAPGKLVPAKGTVQDGYKFKGGDPAKAESWEKV